MVSVIEKSIDRVLLIWDYKKIELRVGWTALCSCDWLVFAFSSLFILRFEKGRIIEYRTSICLSLNLKRFCLIWAVKKAFSNDITTKATIDIGIKIFVLTKLYYSDNIVFETT